MEGRSGRGEGQSTVEHDGGVAGGAAKEHRDEGTVSPTRGTDMVDKEEGCSHGGELVLPHSHSTVPK